MIYEYKMVQIPPRIVVEGRHYKGDEAAAYLQGTVNEQAADGWEFHRIDSLEVTIEPGCLGWIFGNHRSGTRAYYVVSFRREVSASAESQPDTSQ